MKYTLIALILAMAVTPAFAKTKKKSKNVHLATHAVKVVSAPVVHPKKTAKAVVGFLF